MRSRPGQTSHWVTGAGSYGCAGGPGCSFSQSPKDRWRSSQEGRPRLLDGSASSNGTHPEIGQTVSRNGLWTQTAPESWTPVNFRVVHQDSRSERPPRQSTGQGGMDSRCTAFGRGAGHRRGLECSRLDTRLQQFRQNLASLRKFHFPGRQAEKSGPGHEGHLLRIRSGPGQYGTSAGGWSSRRRRPGGERNEEEGQGHEGPIHLETVLASL